MNNSYYLSRLLGVVSVAAVAICFVLSAQAQRPTERELRQFMGLYKGKSIILIRSGGEIAVLKDKFRYRARWKPKGDGTVKFEGGSYRPIYTRVRVSGRSLRSRSLLLGGVTDLDSGDYGTVRGVQRTTLQRVGERRFVAKLYQRIKFGPFATTTVRAIGRK